MPARQLIRRTIGNGPPSDLVEGQFGVELNTTPPALWIGVRTALDPSGRKRVNPEAPPTTLPPGGAPGDTLVWDGNDWVVQSSGPTPQPPAITNVNLAVGGTVNAVFAPYTITASNPPILSFAATPLPAGLALTGGPPANQITGTPGQAGITNVALGASNAQGPSTVPVTLVISIAPTVTAGQITGQAGQAITPFTLQAQGGTPAVFAATPALSLIGLALDANTGQITGTPTVSNPVPARTVTATVNGVTSAGAQLTFNIAAALQAPVVTAGQILNATEGQALASPFQVATTGGAPASFTCTPAPPASLSFNTGNGQISGTPDTGTEAGSPYTLAITATNLAGTSPSVNMTLNVASASSGSPQADGPSPTPPAGPHGDGRMWIDNTRYFWCWFDGGWGIDEWLPAGGGGIPAQPAAGAAPAPTGPGNQAILLEDTTGTGPVFPTGQEDGTIAVEAGSGHVYFWDATAGQWQPIAPLGA